jgi:hypothetical protein
MAAPSLAASERRGVIAYDRIVFGCARARNHPFTMPEAADDVGGDTVE